MFAGTVKPAIWVSQTVSVQQTEVFLIDEVTYSHVCWYREASYLGITDGVVGDGQGHVGDESQEFEQRRLAERETRAVGQRHGPRLVQPSPHLVVHPLLDRGVVQEEQQQAGEGRRRRVRAWKEGRKCFI